jgi:hypothetical protein
MTRPMLVITFVLATLCQGQAQEDRGSANYMLPSCQTWLKVTVERDPEVVESILKTEEPIRVMTSGMCAGVVGGVAETLRMVELACLPEHVSDRWRLSDRRNMSDEKKTTPTPSEAESTASIRATANGPSPGACAMSFETPKDFQSTPRTV